MKSTLFQELDKGFLISLVPEGNQEKALLSDIASGAMRLEPVKGEESVLILRAFPGGTFRCPVCGKDTPHSHASAPSAGVREKPREAGLLREIRDAISSCGCTEHGDLIARLEAALAAEGGQE